MDVDAYVAAHRGDWDRLAVLLGRRRWSGPEADEAVELYQRAATHLSVVRSSSPDPALIGHLSRLVARARTAITGSTGVSWRDVGRFVTVGFAVALASSWRWWASTLVVSVAVMVLLGTWVATDPDVASALLPPGATRDLVDRDFAAYYSSDPASSFAFEVWITNALVAATCLVTGVLIAPVLWVLAKNLVNVGLSGGIMIANDRADVFFGLITPHGLLELTAVFVAAGAGLRLGWAWVDPGPLSRADALAERGRITVGMAIGVAGLLLVSGLIEGFVTPSGLPTWARIGIGVLAELAFLAYVLWGAYVLRRDGDAAVSDVPLLGRGHRAPVQGIHGEVDLRGVGA